MARGVFVSGTDTGVGKTRMSAALLRAAVASGARACGMKPVASGCNDTPEGLRSDDALALIAAGSAPPPPYALANPYAFRAPLAPHLAASEHGADVRLGAILAAYDALREQYRHVVVEGVGGWAVPLSHRIMQADLVRALDLPVLLVVGVRLGCINHALLSARAIEADGCRLDGWVANVIDPSLERADEAIDAIAQRIGVSCLAHCAHDGGEPLRALARRYAPA